MKYIVNLRTAKDNIDQYDELAEVTGHLCIDTKVRISDGEFVGSRKISGTKI